MNTYVPQITDIEAAAQRLVGVINQTPLQRNDRLSRLFDAEIYLKREDLQVVRSFKVRGAYNKMAQLSPQQRSAGVVCASAGNHSQGFAHSCAKIGISGTIFMPLSTPRLKVCQTRQYGGQHVTVQLCGQTFDDALICARRFQQLHGATFVHPFDDPQIIEGQATVAVEILSQASAPLDYLFLPLGGGGLAAGVCSYFRQKSPSTHLVAVEPLGAAAMKYSLEQGENSSLTEIDTFSDGAAVKRIGELGYRLCRSNLDQLLTVDEGRLCSEILQLYNHDAIIAEPAGALSIAALEQLHSQIRGKRVVCILSGGNNDISRIEEIKARSLNYEGRDILHENVVALDHAS